MFKKYRLWFSNLEFSQKLCIWVMSFYGVFSLALVVLFVFVNSSIPIVDIFDKTIIIPVAELGIFGGKTASENIQKIIKSKAESLLKIQSEIMPSTTETETITNI